MNAVQTADKPIVAFRVFGTPASQGSKVSFVSKHARRRDGKHFVVTKEDDKRLRSWRDHVAYQARQSYDGELLSGPLRMETVFTIPRPKHHFKSGDTTRGLRANAPEWCSKKPDSFKLCRAVEDALSGVVYHDDAQIAHHVITRKYGAPCGVSVTIWKL